MQFNNMEETNKIVSISKEELAALPAAAYQGNIILIDTEEGVANAVNALSQETVIGFDTETKPSFKRGQSNKVALLQLATRSSCYLFRLNRIGIAEPIIRLLENESILKIGLSIHDDFHNLNKIHKITPGGFIDLQQFVKKFMIADNSLSRIYGILFGQRISKGQRLTNWEADELSLHQQGYAALDALACIQIYDHLNSGKFNPCESPHLKDAPEPENH